MNLKKQKTARERMPLGLCANLGPPIPREKLLLYAPEPVYNCHYFKGTCTLHFRRNDVTSKLCSDECEGYKPRPELEPVPPIPAPDTSQHFSANFNQQTAVVFQQQIAPFTRGGCCG